MIVKTQLGSDIYYTVYSADHTLIIQTRDLGLARRVLAGGYQSGDQIPKDILEGPGLIR